MSASEEKESWLTDDPDISSQRWCLLSFVSPEKILNRKDQFFFSAYLKQYEFALRSKKMEEYFAKQIQSINTKLEEEASRLESLDLSGAAVECRKSTLSIEKYITDFQAFVNKHNKELSASNLAEDFDDFMYKNQEQLEDDFYAKNNFRTTVRGLKIRGSYSTKEEADMRAKKLQKSDPDHNIYVGQVGKWLPWDPSPSAIQEQEYAEDELNTLMKKYKENEEAREEFHKQQRDRARKTNTKGVINMGGNDYNSSNNLSVSRVEEDSSVPSLGTDASQFNGMFSGPADLAIQRKMQK
jgi:hypothetical protein